MPFTDIRVALRVARRHPGLAILLVVILSSGVAVATAVFGLLNVVWLRPLPYPHPDRLVEIREVHPRLGEERAIARSVFETWRGARALDGVEAYSPRTFAVRLPGRPPEAVPGVDVSPTLLRFLGIPPIAGRLPTKADGAGGRLTAVVSARFVKNRYPGAADAVGQALRLDGRDAVIVGVMPAEFGFVNSAWLLFVPFPTPTAAAPAPVSLVARLRSGVDPRQAAAELDSLAARDAEARGRAGWRARVVPLRDALWSEARPLYALLFVSSALLLLLACANVSNILLAVAIDRQREFAIRLALGAGRRRLGAQMLTEGMAAALAGGALALIACSWLQHLLVASFPELSELRLDYRVFAFSLAVSLAAGGACGLLPVVGVLRRQVNEGLNGRAGWQGPRGVGLGRVLAAAQLAAGCALLISSGLLVRSAFSVRSIDPGFPTDRWASGRRSAPPPYDSHVSCWATACA